MNVLFLKRKVTCKICIITFIFAFIYIYIYIKCSCKSERNSL